ncbi:MULTISPECIES: hypothetical protein [unclassified Streptomyces]|uniref:hypothetical protein n=1 Tax=unclassified Streptomyces TaxID=2593676 RepID=UPI000DC7C03D|nr:MULTISPECIES: hypothetical protein [unclassified Streptomyces]AWZ08365.1 hypothetical protein DRB89_31520 [Streptomyces sp. ICC4]AWZ15918.1 hypothetical protein DRB96_30795 [Streptomyces sp. ICC1]
MPHTLIRLSTGRTNGVAHYGLMFGDAEFLTACATHSPDLAPIGDHTAHQTCQSCTRAILVLMTLPYSGELEARPACGAGRSAAAHRPIPGHLLGYCGKALDYRRTSGKRACANCAHLTKTLDALRRRAGELVLPAAEPCHSDASMLWTLPGGGRSGVGHRRNGATGQTYCGERQPTVPAAGSHECPGCLRLWAEEETVRQMYTLPEMRGQAAVWRADVHGAFEDRAWVLEPGDRYAISGCDEAHHVVAVSRRRYDSRVDLVVYLSGEDRVTDARVHGDRLLRIQRPFDDGSATVRPAQQREA